MPTSGAVHASRAPRIKGLWRSHDAAVWADAYARVPTAQASERGLQAIDDWFFALAETNPHLSSMDKQAFINEVTFTNARNNFRPTMPGQTVALDPASVRHVIAEAGKALGSTAVPSLCLRGGGRVPPADPVWCGPRQRVRRAGAVQPPLPIPRGRSPGRGQG